MKRMLLLPTVLLAGIMLACFSTKAREVPTLTKDGTPVVLEESRTIDDPNNPRTPAVVPLSCTLDSINGELNFTFLFPMGDVAITLTEATAGVVSSDDYSTSLGLVTIPVPYAGTYYISIALSSGVEYIGNFVY